MLISEVSRLSGVSARMLRHYDSTGLVSPTGRTAGGYREYSAADIQRLFHVESLRSLGLSLREIRRALDDPGFAPSLLVDELIAAARERIAGEEELLKRLRRVRSTDPDEWTDVLRIVALMRRLDSDNASQRQRAALSSAQSDAAPAELLAEALLAETDPNVAGALRWALARTGDGGLEVLASALDSPSAELRQRAVNAIAEVAPEAATSLLINALTDSDPSVRGRAALVLGIRGEAGAIATLIGMVVDGTNDVEAAETLGALALHHGLTDRITAAISESLEGRAGEPSARLRLAHALAEVPGPVADRALTALTKDAEPRVALTATSILQTRANSDRPSTD